MRRCDILTEFRVCCSSVRMKQLQFLSSNNRGPEVFDRKKTPPFIFHQNDNDHHHHWDETLRTVEFACESIRFYISTYREQFTLLDTQTFTLVQPWNNGKSGAKLDFTSSTKPGLQIHKFDHTRTANLCDWLPCRCAALPLVGCLSATSPSCWGTHFLYLSNPPSGYLLPIIPWAQHCSDQDSWL